MIIRMKWKIFRPDKRQYRQQSVELEPVNVYVEAKLDDDDIVDVTTEEVIITPAGFHKVHQLLEDLFVNDVSEPETESDDNWDEDDDWNAEETETVDEEELDWDEEDFE